MNQGWARTRTGAPAAQDRIPPTASGPHSWAPGGVTLVVSTHLKQPQTTSRLPPPNRCAFSPDPADGGGHPFHLLKAREEGEAAPGDTSRFPSEL